MKKFALVFLLFFSGLSLFAQEKAQTFTLYFDTDSSRLTSTALQTLDSIKALVEGLDEYHVELSGHTDQQGSIWYNQLLSAKRENSALLHLSKLGLDPNRIYTAHFGESRLAERIEGLEDIAANRRVEVKVRYVKFDSLDDLLRYTRLQNEQIHRFTDNGTQEIVGEKGTQLIIPADAFQTKDGRLVSNAEVQFVLEEFPGSGAAVTHGLSTLADGKILESGGMFRMEALANQDTLVLREGKRIDVLLPSENLKNGMSVFVGQRNAQGDVVWTDTKESFDVVDTTPMPKLPLPGKGEQLLTMQVDLPEKVSYRALEFDWNKPNAPGKPRAPREPKKPAAPHVPEGEEPGWTYVFNSTWRNYYKAQNRYEKSLEAYQKRQEMYAQRLAEYEIKMKQWPKDSADFVAQSNAWDSYLNEKIVERTALLDSVSGYYDAFRYNSAIKSFARKMRDSVYYKAGLFQNLRSASGSDIEMDVKFTLDQLKEEILFLNMVKRNDYHRYKKLIYHHGKPDLNKFKKVYRLERIKSSDLIAWNAGLNRFARNQVFEAELKDTLKAYFLLETGNLIQQKKRELGIFDRNSINEMYSASLGSMGYINCDRFADVPPSMMAKLDVQSDPTSKLYVVLPAMNSVIPLYSGHDSAAVVQLPVGQEIKVISIGTFQGKPTLAMQHYTVKKNENKIILDPRLVTLEVLNRTIAKL